MDMAMASTEASARPPNGYSAAPSSNAPQGSNPMPNSQTPGHPSFRRCVEDRASSADRRNKKDRKLTCSANADSGHRELVRYVAIAFLLSRLLWSKRAEAPREMENSFPVEWEKDNC